MIKKSIMYVSIICLSILIIGSIVNIDLIIDSLYPQAKQIIQLEEYDKEQIKGEGVKAIYNQNQKLKELQVVTDKYLVNTVAIGDSIDRVYQVYDQEQIKEFDNYVEVLGGEKEHYGVMTEYTQYILDEEKNVQEIRTGYTAPFVSSPLMESNQEVKNQLEGVWVSEEGRILDFGEDLIKDSYLDDFWDIQTYHILSPNEILIKRKDNNHLEQIKINIWLEGEKLYIFTVDQEDVPILESTEIFIRVKG